MTIKLPEPTAFSIFDYEGSEALYLMEGNEGLYKRYQQHDPKALDNYCTIEAAKQAIKDALEAAAKICEVRMHHMNHAAGIRNLKDQL